MISSSTLELIVRADRGGTGPACARDRPGSAVALWGTCGRRAAGPFTLPNSPDRLVAAAAGRLVSSASPGVAAGMTADTHHLDPATTALQAADLDALRDAARGCTG